MEKILDNKTLVRALEIYEGKRLGDVETIAFEPSKSFEKRMERLIKSQSNVYYKATLTKARKVIVIAAAISVLIASLMSVSAVRERILGFFISHNENYEITSYDETADSPETIERQFSLGESDYPEGYKLGELVADGSSVSMTLINGADYITIEQFTKKSYVSASDREFDAVRTVNLDGTNYIVRTMDDAVQLVWEKDGYVFEAVGFIPEADMLNLASGVTVN